MLLNPFLVCVLRKSSLSLLLHYHTDALTHSYFCTTLSFRLHVCVKLGYLLCINTTEWLRHIKLKVFKWKLGKSLASMNQLIVFHTGNLEMILGTHSPLFESIPNLIHCVLSLSNEFILLIVTKMSYSSYLHFCLYSWLMLQTGFNTIQLPGRLFPRWKGRDACLVPTVLSTVTCPISGSETAPSRMGLCIWLCFPALTSTPTEVEAGASGTLMCTSLGALVKRCGLIWLNLGWGPRLPLC